MGINDTLFFHFMNQIPDCARGCICALLRGITLHFQDDFALISRPSARDDELEGITCKDGFSINTEQGEGTFEIA